ncbi:MAG: tRNA (guanosine(37)-N1)-methyltransferase TrmD [Alphaproteobacteria bacterium]|nr:tRNA (guanosine(37)-N1)-methyltransferase TrmD [Alphaproteobacteria bacterium]
MSADTGTAKGVRNSLNALKNKEKMTKKAAGKATAKGKKSSNINMLDKNGAVPNSEPFTATILTLFPEAFPGPLALGVHGRALEGGLWRLNLVNPRDFASLPARTVDAPPYGGGAGMVMRADVLGRAIDAVADLPGPLLYLSPRGARLDQSRVVSLSRGGGVRLLCGRYEGVDERLLEHYAIEEVSLGDFVLSGGEAAAMALVEAVVRLRPGVLGNAESLAGESFADGMLEHGHYTRPAVWRRRSVPEVLRGGDHAEVRAWRRRRSREITRARRPDLWAARRRETTRKKRT